MNKTGLNGMALVENRPNTSALVPTLSGVSRLRGLFVFLLLLDLAGCDAQPTTEKEVSSTEDVQADLRIGYKLLADVLSEEARLDMLGLFKKVTFKGPNEAIDQMMKTLSDASERRGAELAKLRHLTPDVSVDPPATSAIGVAIPAVATKIGKSDMMSRSGGFDIRFVLIQAQATRMINAIATAIAQYESNRERKVWLKSLAKEYEGYRDDIIDYLGANGEETRAGGGIPEQDHNSL